MAVELIDAAPQYRGWCTLLVARIKLADGTIIRREIEDHGRAACVLAYDAARKVALVVRQPRAPLLYAAGESDLVEAVAGLIEDGEDAAASARREAMEEVGVRLASVDFVCTAWTMPGVSTERMDLFLAEYSQADRVARGGGVDDEMIEVVEMPLDDLAAIADRGEAVDMKTLVLIQALRLRRPELFAPA
jgi:nudix-type nucleoside diphosphatase (YffH/AdpP family)